MSNPSDFAPPAFGEQRLAHDTPVTESDIVSFEKFFYDFLGKRPDDSVAFLKTLTIFRRGDLREAALSVVAFQFRYEQLIPTLKQRDLMLSFPSVTRNLHDMVFGLRRSYGDIEGQTLRGIAQGQVIDHLDGTEMFRLDINKAMESFSSLLADDRRTLTDLIADGQAARAGNRTFRFVLLILGDHPFLIVMPGQERNSTQAISRVREIIERRLGEKTDEFIIEFFAVGGGFLRWSDGGLLLDGGNALFDPVFADPETPSVAAFRAQCEQHKFALARRILTAEFPNVPVAISQVVS